MLHYVLGNVLKGIDAAIGCHAPERGGVLFGPVGRPMVTHFLHDEAARTTAASYQPSPAIARRSSDVCSTSGSSPASASS